MITVVIPTHNAAATLPAAFRSLMEAAIEGLVSEVILADCGSTDATLKIADAAGATVIQSEPGRQLIAGAKAARKPWLLFLDAASSMEPGWEDQAREFITEGEGGAAAFRLRIADKAPLPKVREAIAAIRTRAKRLPERCNGLLIPAKLLNARGVVLEPLPDEAGLIKSLARGRVSYLKAAVIAGPARQR
jgi:glycosyltransferase involved in cell wall biosynthesis